MDREDRDVGEVGIMESPLFELEEMESDEDGTWSNDGHAHQIKATESGTPITLPSGGFHVPSDAAFTPAASAGASANAFCTSSDDVMSAFNFSSDEEADGYELAQVENSSKITLVCGHLFRAVCTKPAYLAMLLLEPQNKILLNNFLEGFSGTKAVLPWAVGASLKHWAAKLKLFEDDEEEMSMENLPYFKTMQPVAEIGKVADLKAIDQLTEIVKTYLQKMDDETPLSQAVESFGSLVNYIREAVVPAEIENISQAEVEVQSPGSRQLNIREAYEELMSQVRQAEIEILQLEARVASVPRQMSHTEFLYRIAGFKSFSGAFGSGPNDFSPDMLQTASRSQLSRTSNFQLPAAGNTRSKTQTTPLPSLIFPTKSGIFSRTFAIPSNLSVTDSTHNLDSSISITLLASCAPRGQLGVRKDDNGNPNFEFVESNTGELNDDPAGSFSSPTEDDAGATQCRNETLHMKNVEEEVDKLNKELQIDDSSTLALVSELEELARKEQMFLSNSTEVEGSYFCVTPVAESQAEADHLTESCQEAESTEASVSPLAPPTQAEEHKVEANKSNGKGSQAVKAVKPVPFTIGRSRVVGKRELLTSQLQPKKAGNLPRVMVKKTPLNGVGQQKTKGSTGLSKFPTSTTPLQKDRLSKPSVTGKVDSNLRKTPVFHVTKSFAVPPKSTPIRKVEPKIAQGCRRIEFTKVKQTLSYRQLHKANLLILQNSKGHVIDKNVENTIATNNNNRPSTNHGAGTGAECYFHTPPIFDNSEIVNSSPTSKDLCSDINFHDLGIITAPRGTWTPPIAPTNLINSVGGSSSTPISKLSSVSNLKPTLSIHRKPSLGYAALHLQKKVMGEVVQKMTAGTPRVGILQNFTPRKRPTSAKAGTPFIKLRPVFK